jgi:hypothetical protein
MAEVLLDSYSETNQDSYTYLSGNAAPNPDKVGQSKSFTGKSGKLHSCKWYMKKVLSPTGNMTAKLYAHTGTYGTSSKPTGSALATSGNFDVSTLTGSYALVTLTFTGDQQYTMANGTYYCIALEFSGGDTNNYLDIGVDTSSPTHGGNQATTADGSTWTESAGADFPFYVYYIPDTNASFLFFLT